MRVNASVCVYYLCLRTRIPAKMIAIRRAPFLKMDVAKAMACTNECVDVMAFMIITSLYCY